MFGDNGSATPSWAVFLGSATAIGGAIGVITDHQPHELAAAVSGGALVGLLGWLVIALTLNPLLHGTPPTWTVAAAATVYRTLIGAVLHGALTGAALHGLWSVRRPRSGSGAAPVAPLTRVVIVGGGFAGVSAAQRFERLVLRGVTTDVTVISDSNFLLFTPMLAEVASSALEPAHISAPVRSAVAHTRFRHGAVDDIDTTGSAVLMSGERVPYDHLVIAVGSVPSFFDLPGVEENSFTMKDLADATRLRDHVIELLERCDQLTDPQERERLLTFVVAGGGFAGAETVAELFDLVHGVLHLYPGITADEPRFVLVHSHDRILPELSQQLGAYALERLRARGIGFRLGIRVSEASHDAVRLSDGARISTATFVWTAGTRSSPFVARIAGEHARNGALVTDATFRVTGLDRVWAVGTARGYPTSTRAARPSRRPRSTRCVRAGPWPTTSPRLSPGGHLSPSGSGRSGCWSRSDTAPPPPRSAGTASPGWPPGCCGAGSTSPSSPAPRNGCGCCWTGCWTWCSPATSWSPPSPVPLRLPCRSPAPTEGTDDRYRGLVPEQRHRTRRCGGGRGRDRGRARVRGCDGRGRHPADGRVDPAH